MKKCIFLLLGLCLAFTVRSYAQWTTSGNNIYKTTYGNVGIGTTFPDRLFSIQSDSSGIFSSQIRLATFNNASTAANMLLLSKARGSNAFPGAVQSGDILGILQSQGYRTTAGNGFINGASIRFVAKGNGDAGQTPSDIIFNAPTGSAAVDAMVIKSGGNVGLGFADPTHTLTLGTSSSGLAAYNSYTDAANYERVRQYWAGNMFNIKAENAGTGQIRPMALSTNGRVFTINTDPSATAGIFDFNHGSPGGTINTNFASFYGGNSFSTGTTNELALFGGITQTGTAGFRQFWISPYIQTTGTGAKYLIDAGTNTAANGAGTHTSKFTVDNSGYTSIGGGAAVPIVSATRQLFQGKKPLLEVNSGDAPGGYSDLVTIRHGAVNSTPTARQLGLLFKLSSEIDSTESSKHGGLVFESSEIYANNPMLHLVNNNIRALTVYRNGRSGFRTNGQQPRSVVQIGSMSSTVDTNYVGTQLIISKPNSIGDAAGTYSYISEHMQTGTGNLNRLQTALYRRAAGSAWQGMEYRLQYAVDGSFVNGSKAFIAIGGSDPNQSGGGFISLATGGSDRLSVTDSGRVGIQTVRPVSLFQVADNSTKFSIGAANGIETDYGTSYMGFNAAKREQTNNWVLNTDGANNGGSVIYGTIRGDIYFAPLASTAGTTNRTLSSTDIKNSVSMIVKPTGVFANQLTVKVPLLPDYVFKPTYNLRPLAEVKDYITKYSHLPEVPSAAEVAKNGMNVGDMNAALLKKVEELTLYLLQQNDRIKELEKKLANK